MDVLDAEHAIAVRGTETGLLRRRDVPAYWLTLKRLTDVVAGGLLQLRLRLCR